MSECGAGSCSCRGVSVLEELKQFRREVALFFRESFGGPFTCRGRPIVETGNDFIRSHFIGVCQPPTTGSDSLFHFFGTNEDAFVLPFSGEVDGSAWKGGDHDLGSGWIEKFSSIVTTQWLVGKATVR